MLINDKKFSANDTIVLKWVHGCYRRLTFDQLFFWMLFFNDVSASPLIVVCALCVHRERQESLARADREDQRLVLPSTTPSHILMAGLTWACLKRTYAHSCIFWLEISPKMWFQELWIFLQGPRGERGPRGPTGKAGPKVGKILNHQCLPSIL